MKWIFWAWIALFCISIGTAAVAVVTSRGDGSANSTPALQPLSSATNSAKALPEGTLLLTIADGAELKAPFVLREQPLAAGGVALIVPKGARSHELVGRATLTAKAQTAGDYRLWVRVLWRDSCSNSAAVQVGANADLTVGNDSVYGSWHWVGVGTCKLAEGENTVTLKEREDGIEIDQLLFTRDTNFTPTGPISAAGELRGIRQFGDDFTRSPGHGMEAWDLASGKWHISFSFDPNRIPNQYALIGEPENGTAVALVKNQTWNGCRVAFSVFPEEASRFGVVVDRASDGSKDLRAVLDVSDSAAKAECGPATDQHADLTKRLRVKQWHRVEIERWAWTLRIRIDGKNVCARHDLPPGSGLTGLFVEKGQVFFDDLIVEEIPWFADDGAQQQAPWTVAPEAQWFRGTSEESGKPGLFGKAGSLSLAAGALSVAEVLIEEEEGSAGQCAVAGDSLEESKEGKDGALRVLRAPRNGNDPRAEISATAGGKGVRIKRIAARFQQPTQDRLIIGPYHFTESEIEDPSDYLDFTPEEYKKMEQSPDADKLRREAKFKPLVGSRRDDESPWVRESGAWRIWEGVLSGYGTLAQLRYAQELAGPFEVRMKFRMGDIKSAFEIDTYGGPDPALRLRIGGLKPERIAPPVAGFLFLDAPGDTLWHSLVLKASPAGLIVQIDKNPEVTLNAAHGHGGRMYLRIAAGRMDFDDIEIHMDRKREDGAIAAFQSRETDWWREGEQWIDHGGIACVLASSWVSLIASDSAGMLWHKDVFGPDVLAAFDVEENSEWYGWDKYPSHYHFAYDNLCIGLSAGGDEGYRLEVNAENRRATILYRNGKEVARVRQDGSFPIHFVGGHMPYFPRRNRVILSKRGGDLRAIINGREILKYKDEAPLSVRRVGIGGYQTRANFSHIEIVRLK